MPVGSDEPAEAYGLAINVGGREASRFGRCRRELQAAVEKQVRAGFEGTICQQRMEVRTADTDAGSTREAGVDAMEWIFEADAAEGMSVSVAKGDAELGERRAGIRHKTLAAGLVDRVWAGLNDGTFDAALAKCDRSGKPGGTTSDDQDFGCRECRDILVQHWKYTTSALSYYSTTVIRRTNKPFEM